MMQHRRGIRTIWAMVGLLAVGLVLAGAAGAQQAPGPFGPPAPKASLLTPEDRAAMGQIYWHRIQQTLGLTEQQATEIRTLLDAQRTAARDNFKQLRAARKQLQSLLAQPTVDSAAVQAAATSAKALQATLFDARLQTQLALRAKLTPEQWQQWQTLRQGRWAHGRGPRPGGGPGM